MVRNFLIVDIDCVLVVEVVKRKTVLSYMDEFVENLGYSWFRSDDETFEILYDDGSWDFIDGEYDGHKIKRQHIVSMVYSNPCTYMVFGAFSMNEYGVVHTAEHEDITTENIWELSVKNLIEEPV